VKQTRFYAPTTRFWQRPLIWLAHNLPIFSPKSAPVGIGFDATWADLRKFAPSTALFTPRQSFCEHIGQEKT
jgi:hypothetical protein